MYYPRVFKDSYSTIVTTFTSVVYSILEKSPIHFDTAWVVLSVIYLRQNSTLVRPLNTLWADAPKDGAQEKNTDFKQNVKLSSLRKMLSFIIEIWINKVGKVRLFILSHESNCTVKVHLQGHSKLKLSKLHWLSENNPSIIINGGRQIYNSLN